MTRTLRDAIALAIIVLVPSLARAEEEPKTRHEDWKVIHLAGQRVGYGHVSSHEIERGGRTLIVTDDVTQMTIKRFGQTLVMRVEVTTTETPDGELIEMRSVTRNPPAAPSKSTAIVRGEKVHLELETGGKTTTRTLDWEPGTKSPSWTPADGENTLEPGEEREYSTFLPELNRRATVTTKAVGLEEVELPDGTKRRLLRTVTGNDVIPGKTTAFLDEKGREVLTKIDLLGTEMVLHSVPREEALAKIEGAEFDLAVKTLIPVRRIPNAHETKRIVYRIHADGDDPADYIPDDDWQDVKRIDDDTIEVSVSAAHFMKPANRATEAEYRKPSRFLQSDDPRVAAHAKRAIADVKQPETNAAGVVRAMEKYVRDELSEKNFSTAMASAAEVAEKMEGDCTEHAVLLAAMLRAEGVPSRIAVGLVYAQSRSAFAGHMWTEAFVDGHWIPIDGTLGRGGTRAAHLKMADSAFSDDSGHPIAAFLPVLQSIGKLRIEVIEVE